jgi:hypothetical protein
MATGDIEVNEMIATIECDDSVHKITINGAGCNLVNVGTQSVFISQKSETLLRTGEQENGEIKLDPNDSIPIPVDASAVWHQCAATETTKLWYVPRAG